MKLWPRSWLWRSLIVLLLLCGVGVIAVRMLIRSVWLAEEVRVRIIAETEKATGGKAELRSFRFDWERLTAHVEDFVLHGSERDGEPLVRVPKAAVELKVISFLDRRINVAAITVDGVTAAVRRGPDGKWNLPQRADSRPGASPVQQILRLAAEQIQIRNGALHYEDRRVPLDLDAREVDIDLKYLTAEKAYRGDLKSKRVRVREPLESAVEMDVAGPVRFDEAGLDLPQLALSFGKSKLMADVRLRNWEAPQVGLKVEGRAEIADLHAPLRLPVERSGYVQVSGDLNFADGKPLAGAGTIVVRGAGYSTRGVRIAPVDMSAKWAATETRVTLDDLRAAALGGSFAGKAALENGKRFLVEGEARGLALERLYALRSKDALVWSGVISGPLRLEGQVDGPFAARVQMAIAPPEKPAEGTQPISGQVAARYESGRNDLLIETAYLALPSSRLNVQGDPNSRLELSLLSTNLDDFLPALRLATADAAVRIPARLQQGQLRVDGFWTGGVRTGKFTGRVSAGPLAVEGRRIESVQADLTAQASGLLVDKLTAKVGPATLEGSGTLAMAEWKPSTSSALRGTFQISGARIEEAAALAGQTALPVTGQIQGRLHLEGTLGAPAISGRLEGDGIRAWDEEINAASVEFRASENNVEVVNGTLEARNGRAEFSGAVSAPAGDWRNSNVRFQLQAKGFTLEQWNFVTRVRKGFRGTVSANASGSFRLRGGEPDVSTIQGMLTVANLVLESRPLGEVEAKITTKDRLVTLQASAILGGAQVNGNAEWSLGASKFGLGQFNFRNVTLTTLQDLGILDPRRAPAARGVFEGEIGFSGPILEPAAWTANAKLTKAELRPSLRGGTRREQDVQKFYLRNEGPVLAYIDRNGVKLTTARFVGEGTDITAGGTIALQGRSPMNLQLTGKMNLPALSVLEPDLLATGQTAVNVQMRGTIEEPQVTGTAELKDATFYLRGVPNGLERVNGLVRFDRNRATIEKFTALSGGGELALGGFVGFSGNQLVYRLTARARRVRVRYPEAVSTTFDADLNLSGTSEQSLLAGSVIVNRLGLNPQSDLGGMLAEASRSGPTAPTTNTFMRGMQLDVRVETSADAELQTSLTRDIQPEASLKLRGTAARPSVLGRVSVNEGEIQFFGNEYRITRGEIGFFNPIKVEPILNLDLETRARGITVTINLSGPPNKLNVSYRSDPPLQSNEIVALLTVGRAPASATSSGAPASQSQSFLQGAGNSLLGAAISAPVNSRLQRFFGVSRIKIDPELNSLTNTPQARLTIEQQLSREITVTYITNLNRTQNQIVRLQWDFSRDFSVLAVRDENGIFGVDFQYRRRF